MNAYTDNQQPLVTPYYYQLTTGSCTDTFTSKNFSQLVTSPPTDLVESYLKCYSYRNYAFLNSVGVAAGSVQSAMPIMLMLIMPIIYIFLKYNGLLIFLEERYPPLEKEQALKELAEYILMIRDGKKTPLKRTGLVYRITEELITAARQSVLEEDEMVKDLTSNPNKIPGIENRRKSIFAMNRTFSMMPRSRTTSMNSIDNSSFRRKSSFEDSNYSSAEDDDDESGSDGTRGEDETSSRRNSTRRPFSHEDNDDDDDDESDDDDDESDDDDVDNHVQLGAYSSHVRRPNGAGKVSININEESKVSFADSFDRGGIKHRSPPKPPKPTDNSSYAEI